MEFIMCALLLQINKNTSPKKMNESLFRVAYWGLIAAGFIHMSIPAEFG